MDLQEYLKTYSTINNKFIDDFFSLPFTLNYKPTLSGRKFYGTPVPLHWGINPVHTVYKKSTTSTDFIINLDNVCKWLKANKANIKRTLLYTYTENLDYIIELDKSSGGRPPERILLTPDCFKRLSTVKIEF